MLPRYRQHVARTSNLLPGNMLPWCKRGLRQSPCMSAPRRNNTLFAIRLIIILKIRSSNVVNPSRLTILNCKDGTTVTSPTIPQAINVCWLFCQSFSRITQNKRLALGQETIDQTFQIIRIQECFSNIYIAKQQVHAY